MRGHIATRPSAALATLVGLCLVVAGCGGGSDTGGGGSESVSSEQSALYKKAKETNGGKLTVFLGSSATTELDAMSTGFNEDFPGIDIQWIAATSDEVLERFQTEQRAGLKNADVISLAGMSPFEELHKEGFLKEYTPEEADLFVDNKATFIPNVAYAFADINLGACYNPENVSDEEIELLKSYEGWADPAFKGRSALLDPGGFGPRRAWSYWVYEDPNLGKPWLEKLAALDPVIYKSANTAAPLVIAGEYDVMFNSLTVQGPRAAKDGAPLRCTTAEYAPTYPFSTALANNAPNEAAGKLFVNWILTETGQRIVQENFAYNAKRQGFDEPVLEEDWWVEPTDVRFADEALLTEKNDDLTKTFGELFGTPEDE